MKTADPSSDPPGRGADPSAAKHVLVLIVAGLILWAATCGLWDLQGPDEGRYVQVAKELLGRSNWLVLTVGGEPYSEKMPPPFWVLAELLRLNGGEPCAWLLRLPSVFAAIATIALTYLIGRKMHGWRAGWIAAWVLMTTPLMIQNAAEAKLDMVFTALVVLSLAAWLTRDRTRPLSWPRAALMWLALAASIFYKGPISVVIVLSTIGAEACGERSWAPLRKARAVWGILLVAVIFGAWYGLQGRTHGGTSGSAQIWKQIVERILHGDHAEPIWYYPPQLLVIFAPWSLLPIPIGIDFWRRRRVPEPVRPMFFWFLVPFIVFSIASGKRQFYLMPLMPPLALIVGWWLAPRLSKSRAPKWLRPLTAGLLVAAGALLPMFYLVVRLAPKLADRTHMQVSGTILAVSALIGIVIAMTALRLLMKPAALPRIFAAVVATMLLFGFSGFTCLNPARNDYSSTRAFAANIDRAMRERNLRTLAGVESAAKAEYYVYAHHPAGRFEEEELQGKKPMPGPLTDVLVVPPGNLKHLSAIIDRYGYRLLFKETAAGDELCVFAK